MQQRLALVAVALVVLVLFGYGCGPRWLAAPAYDIAQRESEPALELRWSSVLVELHDQLRADVSSWFEPTPKRIHLPHDGHFLGVEPGTVPLEDVLDESQLAALEMYEELFRAFDEKLADPSTWKPLSDPQTNASPGSAVGGEPARYDRLSTLIGSLAARGHWAIRRGDREGMRATRDAFAASTAGFGSTRNLRDFLATERARRTAVEEWCRLALLVRPGADDPVPASRNADREEILRGIARFEQRQIARRLRSYVVEGEPVVYANDREMSRWDRAITLLGFAYSHHGWEVVHDLAPQVPSVNLFSEFEKVRSSTPFAEIEHIWELSEAPNFSGLEDLLIEYEAIEHAIPLIVAAHRGEPFAVPDDLRLEVLPDRATVLVTPHTSALIDRWDPGLAASQRQGDEALEYYDADDFASRIDREDWIFLEGFLYLPPPAGGGDATSER